MSPLPLYDGAFIFGFSALQFCLFQGALSLFFVSIGIYVCVLFFLYFIDVLINYRNLHFDCSLYVSFIWSVKKKKGVLRVLILLLLFRD